MIEVRRRSLSVRRKFVSSGRHRVVAVSRAGSGRRVIVFALVLAIPCGRRQSGLKSNRDAVGERVRGRVPGVDRGHQFVDKNRMIEVFPFVRGTFDGRPGGERRCVAAVCHPSSRLVRRHVVVRKTRHGDGVEIRKSETDIRCNVARLRVKTASAARAWRKLGS